MATPRKTNPINAAIAISGQMTQAARGDARTDAAASRCRRALPMVVRGVCPRCGGRARLWEYNDWDCWKCGWSGTRG